MKKIVIFHGGNKEVMEPLKSKGKDFNDYGQGFYCTLHPDLAAQWACKFQEDGIVNEYEIDTRDLNVLNLDGNYNILNWLSILVDNREISGDAALSNKKYIVDNYMIEYKNFDIIIGYRADDAYFRIVREFLYNTIGVNTLDESMYLGKIGLQVFIQSEKAFSKMQFINSIEVNQEEHYIKSNKMIEKANLKYEKLKMINEKDDLYIRDIKGGELNEDVIPKIKIK